MPSLGLSQDVKLCTKAHIKIQILNIFKNKSQKILTLILCETVYILVIHIQTQTLF